MENLNFAKSLGKKSNHVMYEEENSHRGLLSLQNYQKLTSWFHGSSFKGFSIDFLFSDWLKLNHLKSRIECGFSDIFSSHFCSTLVETIGFTTTQQVLARKNVQKTTFEAAEMILSP